MFLLHNDCGVTFNLSQLTDYLNLFIKQNAKKKFNYDLVKRLIL